MSIADTSESVRLTDQQRLDWLRLIRSENVGPRTFRALVNHFGGAGAALDALPALARRGGAERPGKICPLEDAERELAEARRQGIAWVALGEPEYPPRLRMIDDPPPLIAVRGKPQALASPMVAIVGSRNASAAGAKFSGQIARKLGAAGFVVVSGLARGIDAAAHRATLTTGTIAVLAGGHQYSPGTFRLGRLHSRTTVPPLARCRAPGSRAAAISRAATVSYPAFRSASSLSRRRGARAR